MWQYCRLFQYLKKRLSLKDDAKVRNKSETAKHFPNFFSFYPKIFYFFYKMHPKLHKWPYFVHHVSIHNKMI